jgi:hypothetical protein
MVIAFSFIQFCLISLEVLSPFFAMVFLALPLIFGLLVTWKLISYQFATNYNNETDFSEGLSSPDSF